MRLVFVALIATIGADRFDLLGGNGPVVLKPFLVLAPLVVVLEGARAIRRGGGPRISQDARWLLVAQTALLSILLVSVAWSLDMSLALGRLALMTVEAYLCFLAVLLLVNRADAREILVRGAVAGLGLMLVMDLLQVGRFLNEGFAGFLELGGVIDLSPTSYGGLIPRPSGVAVDPNRTGFLVLIYIFLLWLLAKPSARRTAVVAVGWVLLLITLSRSAILAAIFTTLGWLVWRGVRMRRTAIVAPAAAGTALVLLLVFSGATREAAMALGEMLAGRVSLSEGSSSDHLSLIARGWEVGTDDLSTLFFGIGFGNSYLVLQDFFGGTKYANFHSMYITFLVEAGMFSLVPVAVLMGYPFVRGSDFRPIVLGLIFFNIFYQAHSEAMFWLVLALAWMVPDAAGLWRHGSASGRIGRPGSGSDTVPTPAPGSGRGAGPTGGGISIPHSLPQPSERR